MKKIILFLMLLSVTTLFAASPELEKAYSYEDQGDMKNAEKYYKLAYEKGDPDAAGDLGTFYFNNKKVNHRLCRWTPKV